MTQISSNGRPRRLDTNQVAQRFRVCAKTVRNWIRRGKLGAYVTADAHPNAQRYEFDEAQLADFERTHWRRLPGPGEATPEPPAAA